MADSPFTIDVTPDWEAFVDCIRMKGTPNRVSMLILTHSDGDHVNGLSGFPKGLKIVAHANCRREMEEALKDPSPAVSLSM